MTKSELTNHVQSIYGLIDNRDAGENEELGEEALKDLIDKLVNLTSLCQASLLNNVYRK